MKEETLTAKTESMENKVNIIKQIVKFHPSEGVKEKYSWYTGGMADTGSWYWEKMIDEPDWKLQQFLDKLNAEKVSNEKEQARRNALKTELGEEEYYRRIRIVEENAMKDFFKQEEMALMWGSTMTQERHWKDYYNDPSNYWNKKK